MGPDEDEMGEDGILRVGWMGRDGDGLRQVAVG